MVWAGSPKAEATIFYVDAYGVAQGNIDVGLRYHYTGLFADVMQAPAGADCRTATQWTFFLANIAITVDDCTALSTYQYDLVWRIHNPTKPGGWQQFGTFSINDIPGMVSCCNDNPPFGCEARFQPMLVKPTCP
jgi:hypothetical protein